MDEVLAKVASEAGANLSRLSDSEKVKLWNALVTQYVEQFVENLPELDNKKFINGLGYNDWYMYVYREKKCWYSYLLNTGELVVGTFRTNSKTELKRMIQAGAEYIGIGILHKD